MSLERPVRLFASVGLVEYRDRPVDVDDRGDELGSCSGRAATHVGVDLVSEVVENALQDQLILGCEVAPRSVDDGPQAVLDRGKIAVIGL